MSKEIKKGTAIILEPNVHDFVLSILEILEKYPNAKFNKKSAGITERDGIILLTCKFDYKLKLEGSEKEC